MNHFKSKLPYCTSWQFTESLFLISFMRVKIIILKKALRDHVKEKLYWGSALKKLG